MILLMLGTNPYPFDRLLRAVDAWAGRSGEKVVAQTGHTRGIADHVECHDFVSHAQIMAWIAEARLVITQGGFGSMRDSLSSGKPTIAVPRMPGYGECQDEQAEIVDALAGEGRVIALYDVGKLDEAIRQAGEMQVTQGGGSRIPAMVREAVDRAMGRVSQE